MNSSDQMFLALLTNDFLTVLCLFAKNIAGLFLSPDAIAIYVVIALGLAIFKIHSMINSSNDNS